MNFIYKIDRNSDKKSGIYKISNDRNTRIYIGSTNYLRKRYLDHCSDLKGNRHRNARLQNFYNKYRELNYDIRFDIIELCHVDDLLEKENYYLNILKPYYNICLDASRSQLGRKISKLIRKKISETQKRNFQNGRPVLNRAPIIETKCPLCGKLFKAKKRRTKKLQKYCSMGCKHKGQVIVISRPIFQLDLNNNIIREWMSAKEAGETLVLNKDNIGDCCRKKHQTAHKHKWIFADEYNKEKWIKCESIPLLSAICN